MFDAISPRVLVIDDEITQRMLVKEYLEADGFQVRLSEDGRHGLKMATTVNLDLIIVDAVLPSLDGYSLVAQLRQHEKTADLPIILITASKEPDAIAKGLAAGATDFITKPVEWQFFSDRVTHVLDRSREKRQLEAQRDEMFEQLKANQGKDERRARNIQSDLQKVTQAFEQERVALLADTEERIKSATAEAAEQIEEMQREHERKRAEDRAEAEAQLQAARATFEKQARAVRSEADERIKKAHASTALLVESGRRSAEQQMKALKAATEAQLLDAKAELASQMDRLQRTAAERIRRAEQALEDMRRAASLPASVAVTGDAETSTSIWAFASAIARQQAKLTQSIYDASAAADAKLAADAPAEEIREAMTRVQRAAAGLMAFMKSYALMTELMASSGPAARDEIVIGDLLAPIADRVAALCADRQLVLDARITADMATIAVDTARLRYAVLGLVLNAVRFSVANSAVMLFAERTGDGGLAIGVSDEGVGIAPVLRERIERCLTDPAALIGPRGETVGLGLAVASAVARSHGGQLSLEGNIGRGTTVAILLPPDRICAGNESGRTATGG